MFCTKCGSEQVDNPKFCRNCGEKLRPQDTIGKMEEQTGNVLMETMEEQSRTAVSWSLMWIGVLIGVFVFLVFFFILEDVESYRGSASSWTAGLIAGIAAGLVASTVGRGIIAASISVFIGFTALLLLNYRTIIMGPMGEELEQLSFWGSFNDQGWFSIMTSCMGGGIGGAFTKWVKDKRRHKQEDWTTKS